MGKMNLTKKPIEGECHANRCKASPEFVVDASWLDGEEGQVVELCEAHAERAIKDFGIDEEHVDDAFVPMGDGEDEDEPPAEEPEDDEPPAEPKTAREKEEAEYDRKKAMVDDPDYDPEGAHTSPWPYSPVKKGKAMLTEADKGKIVHLRIEHKMQDESIGKKLGISVKVVRWYLENFGHEQPQSDLILSEEARALAKEATTEGKDSLAELKAFEIEGQDDLDFAAEVLAEVKGKWKRLDAEEKKITKPINEALKAARDLFRKPKKLLVQIEGTLKGKIGEFHLAEQTRNAEAMKEAAEAHKQGSPAARKAALKKMGSTSQVEGVSVTVKWDFVIEDEDALPREFMMANEKLIKEHASHSTEREPTPIPGVRFFPKPTVSSRST